MLGILSIVLITIGVIFLKRKWKNNRRQRIDRFPLACKQLNSLLVYNYLHWVEVSISLGVSTLYPSKKRDLANNHGVKAKS